MTLPHSTGCDLIQLPPGILTLRCSSLDLLWECTGSIEPGATLIDLVGEPADMGNALHCWFHGIEDPETQREIAELADVYGVDADELDMLASITRNFWHNRLKHFLAGGDAEIPMSMDIPFPHHGYKILRLTGHLDKTKPRSNRVHTFDLKSGRVEGDYRQQQWGYAALALERSPECDQVWTALGYPRIDLIDAKLWSRKQVEAWKDDLVWRMRNAIGKFNPGTHCAHCPRKYDCEAADRYFQKTVQWFSGGVEVNVKGERQTIDPALAEAVRTARMVGKEADRCVKLARDYARSNGQEILPEDGKRFELVKRKSKRLDPQKAWPVLARHLTPEQMASFVRLSKGGMEKAIKDTAEEGEKGKRMKSVLDELEEAGAFKETTTERLEEIRYE